MGDSLQSPVRGDFSAYVHRAESALHKHIGGGGCETLSTTSPGLQELCYSKENTFQQKPGSDTLLFLFALLGRIFCHNYSVHYALSSLDWEGRISQVPGADVCAASPKALQIRALGHCVFIGANKPSKMQKKEVQGGMLI